MTGWLIALGILFLLAILPIGIRARYNDKGFLVQLLVGPVKAKLYPSKKKEEPQPEEEEPEEEQEEHPLMQTLHSLLEQIKPPKPPKEEKKKPAPKKQKGGKISQFLPYVGTVVDFLGDFRWKIRISRLELKVIMADSDPCDLALNYGKAWAALGNFYPMLERAFIIKKRKIEVECDFTAKETLVLGRIDITITLGRLIALLVRYAIRGLRIYMNTKKGGASK